jgi:sarcosine oxidase subunit delta
MFLIECPYCGPRAQAEFAYERSVDSIAPLDAEPSEAIARLYTRENPYGPSAELWRHAHGCRAWLTLRRDTATHAIYSVEIYGRAP